MMSQRIARRESGFSLIELCVVMLVIAIVSAIAVPSYTSYVNRSKRTAAKAVLVDTAAQLERNYTTFGCYNKTNAATCQSQAAGNDYVVPNATAPIEARAAYAVAVAFPAAVAPAVTGQTYTLTATPCGSSGTCPAGSESYTDADCGTLQITQTGQRTSTGTQSAATCWQR